jgi:RNA 2',3'-cyclic 3'-phosphodiesterase
VRLFVAAYPPERVRDDLAALVGTLAIGRPPEPGRSLRLAPPEQWHLTLAFLGDIPDDDAPATHRAVDEAVRAGPAPTIQLAGGGRFGRGRFTIVWVGIRGDLTGLRGLATVVRRRLKSARLPFDPKPYRPHLTLARPGDRLPAEAVAADLAALDGYQGPMWTVGPVALMRSYPGPHPVYEKLGEWTATADRP